MRRRAGLWCLAGLAALFVFTLVSSPALITAHVNARQMPHSASLIARSWRDSFVTPWFWGFLAIVAVLERLFPARRGEGIASIGAAQDLVWFVLFACFQLTLVRGYYALLGGVAQHVFFGFSVHVAAVVGGAGAVVFAFVATDLLNWFTHYVRHRVPALWHFHEIHHSQHSMNIFTNERVHFVEAMVASTLVFVPSALFGLPGHQAAAIATISLFYQRLFHANIRTNLGPLRYVLVTPQSHRVHHASTVEYYDTNFGVVFSVWDRIFGSQHADDRSYPAVGLADGDVPVEHSARPLALVATYARQVAYPFRAVLATSRPARRDAQGRMRSSRRRAWLA